MSDLAHIAGSGGPTAPQWDKAKAMSQAMVERYAIELPEGWTAALLADEVLAHRYAIGGHDRRDTLVELIVTVRDLINESSGSTYEDVRRHHDAWTILGEVLDRLGPVTP